MYRSYLRLHILPTFGELRLDEITPGMVNNWHDDLLNKGKTSGSATRWRTRS